MHVLWSENGRARKGVRAMQDKPKMYIVDQGSFAHCGVCHQTFRTLHQLNVHKCDPEYVKAERRRVEYNIRRRRG